MATNAHILSSQDIFTNPSGGQIQGRVPRDVGQDKRVAGGAQAAFLQSASLTDPTRVEQSGGPSPAAPTPHRGANTLQQLTLHVRAHLKAEVTRQAEIAGLSVSATGAALLEEILRQKLHIQQAATLESALTKIITKSNRAMATRFASLLVRIAFDTGQTRVLATNSLGRQEGMTEETLKEILATADKRTKANLTRKTPQLTELVETVEQWLLEGIEKEEGR